MVLKITLIKAALIPCILELHHACSAALRDQGASILPLNSAVDGPHRLG